MPDPIGDELLLTADPGSRELALQEVLSAAPGSELKQWLSRDVGWVALSTSWASLVSHLRELPPIFCRHICPVHVNLPLTKAADDVVAIVDTAAGFVDDLDPARSFSVQTRLLGRDWPYGPYDINTQTAKALAQSGAVLDVRNPVQVLSIVATSQTAYLGLSLAADNLSDWAGGARRFRREKGQISRAEFKLLEALEIFHLEAEGARSALDLGAAPGGWTRVLRQRGVRVVAVDPAALDSRLERDEGVRHVRQLAEDFLPSAEGIYGIILNDMRLDARDSARLMVRAVEHLHPRGWGVMTLKLPKHDFIRPMQTALEMLARSYDIIGVRQLFHNRSEVTVALQRRESVAWPRGASS